MSNWIKVKLGDIVELKRESYHPKPDEVLPYIGLEHIGQGTLRLISVGKSNEVTSTKSYFLKGDILFGKLRPYFRKVVRPKFNGVCSTDILVLTSKNPRKFNQTFLFYLMASQEMIDLATASSSGTKMPRADWKVLQNLEISIPEDVNEQERIGKILETIDDKIDINIRMNKTLEEMAMTLYKHWFVDFGPFQDGEFVESELGMIPKGWSICELEEIVEKIDERVKAGEHLFSLPYVPIDVLNQKSLMINGYKHGSEAKSSLVKFYKGDILFGAMRPYFHKVCIAPFDGITRTTCFVLRPKNNDYYAFVVATIFREETIDYANSHSKGSTIPYADWETLSKMKVILPPLQYLKEYNEKVVPLFKLMIQNFLNNEELVKTRDYLLPRLLSGEIDLSKAEKQVEKVL